MTRIALIALIALFAQPVMAEPKGDTVEAGKRFNAGVALYNEADYRAALVEFKRAFDIAPNPAVLYNIGQTHYMLQNYAAAYITLTRYLAESGADAVHKDEVTKTLQTLQSRVGKIDVMANVQGAEVRIDEELVGKTPLAAPVMVSVGRRKVEVTYAGREPQSRVIDVAAGDTIRQEIVLQEPKKDVVAPPPVVAPVEKPQKQSTKLVPALWVTTGVLAAGAITTGIVAVRAANRLETMRGQFPIDRAKLTDQSDKVKLYARLGDGLGIAAIAVGATALTFTILKRSGGQEKVQVSVMPGGLVVGSNF